MGSELFFDNPEGYIHVLREKAEQLANPKVLEKIIGFLVPAIQQSQEGLWPDEISTDICVFLDIPHATDLYNFNRVEIHGHQGYEGWQRKDYLDYYWVLEGKEYASQ